MTTIGSSITSILSLEYWCLKVWSGISNLNPDSADVATNLIKEEEADNQDEVLFKETFVSLNDYIDYIKSKNETNSRVNDKQVEELTVIIKLMKLKNF